MELDTEDHIEATMSRFEESVASEDLAGVADQTRDTNCGLADDNGSHVPSFETEADLLMPNASCSEQVSSYPLSDGGILLHEEMMVISRGHVSVSSQGQADDINVTENGRNGSIVDMVSTNSSNITAVNREEQAALISFSCNEPMSVVAGGMQIPTYVLDTAAVYSNTNQTDSDDIANGDHPGIIIGDDTVSSAQVERNQLYHWPMSSDSVVRTTSSVIGGSQSIVYRDTDQEYMSHLQAGCTNTEIVPEAINLVMNNSINAVSHNSEQCQTSAVITQNELNAATNSEKNGCEMDSESVHHNVVQEGMIAAVPATDEKVQNVTSGCLADALDKSDNEKICLNDADKIGPSLVPEIKVSSRNKKQKNDMLVYSDQSLCSNVMKLLKAQRELGQFCDVVINVRGCQYWAHRCILSANSSYLMGLLKNSHNQNSSSAGVEQITLPCDSCSALEEILDYMYTGQMFVSIESVHNILYLAGILCMEGVIKICRMHLRRSINLITWPKVRIVATEHQFHDVLEHIYSFLVKNICSVAHGNEIFALKEDEVSRVCNFKLSTIKGIAKTDICFNKFVLVFRWVQSNVEERLHGLSSMLALINPSHIEDGSLDCFLKEMEYEDSFLVHHSTIAEFVARVQSVQNCPDNTYYGSDFVEPSMSEQIHGHNSRNETTVEDKADHKEGEHHQDVDCNPPMHVKQLCTSECEKQDMKPNSVQGKSKRGRPRKCKILESIDAGTTCTTDSIKESQNEVVNDSSSALYLPWGESRDLLANDSKGGKRKRGRPRKNEATSEKIASGQDKPVKNADIVSVDGDTVSRRPGKGRKASCPRRFQTVRRKVKGPPHRCTYADCDYIAPRKGMLVDHLNGHEGIKAYLCNICNKKFLTMRHLRRHQKMHSIGKQHLCENCPFASYRQDKLKDHITRRHPEVALEKGWVTEEELESLKIAKSCNGKQRKPRLKPQESSPTSVAQIDSNVLGDDRIQKDFSCEKCPRTFQTSHALACHMKGHGRNRPYLCEICGFSSVHFRSITLHKRRHSGKVYHCGHEGCSYTNVFKERFIDHVNKHAGIKNHICSVCGKAFAARKHMQRHEKSHSNTDTHACGECNYKSGRRDKLNEHIRRHHPYIAVAIGLLSAEALETMSAKTPPKSRKFNTKFDLETEQAQLTSVPQQINIITQLPTSDLGNIVIQQQLMDGHQLLVGQDTEGMNLGSTPVTLAPVNLNTSHVQTSQADGQPAYIDNLALYALSNYTWSAIHPT